MSGANDPVVCESPVTPVLMFFRGQVRHFSSGSVTCLLNLHCNTFQFDNDNRVTKLRDKHNTDADYFCYLI